jgi:1,4-dihydroxy-2-naphthoyl-CoA hydrolase
MIDVPFRHTWGFDGAIGYTVERMDADEIHAHVPVGDHLRQPMGLVHGGVYASMAESSTSVATAMAVLDDGMIAVGQSNQTSFVRPITQGTIHMTARRRHRGRTSWIWEVDFTDDAGKLCAIVRMTIAVRPAPEGWEPPTPGGSGS